MDVVKKSEDGMITLLLAGEIDGSNVDEFEEKLTRASDETEMLVLDFDAIEYISSAGLRSLLVVQKRMKQRDHLMKLINVNDEVMEIFSVTGFVRLLNIESP